jgi:hypothetical protein
MLSRKPHRPFAAPQAIRGRPGVSARTIGALTPRLTKTAFQKFGFATAQLVTDWPQIVGDRLAKTTAPDKIRWPRRPGDPSAGETAEPANGSPRAGATLVLRVEPALALDVQYQSRLILDRINAHFGYRAVAELRIVQGPVDTPTQWQAEQASARPSARPARRPLPPPVPVSDIPNEDLKAALDRMQMLMRNRRG